MTAEKKSTSEKKPRARSYGALYPKKKPRRVPSRFRTIDDLGWGSLYRKDFHQHPGEGIWLHPKRWFGIRNMFSEKPRDPDIVEEPPQYFHPKSPYGTTSDGWRSDYRSNIGSFTYAEGLANKRERMFKRKPGADSTLPTDYGSSNWTSDYREGPGSHKTPAQCIAALREPSEINKPKCEPFKDRKHPHWSEVKENKYVKGDTVENNTIKGKLASDYIDGSGYRDEPKIYRSTRQSKDEYRHIRGRDWYTGKPLVGY